jgi:mannosyltransferase
VTQAPARTVEPEQAAAGAPRPRPTWAVYAVPAAVTGAVGLWQVTRPQLWRDELASWDAATRSWSQLFRLLGHTDVVSATYYLFLHVWVSVFGSSTLSLRLPSVLAMAAAAAVTASVGSAVGGGRVGLVAGLMFAALPVVARYAQEARGYAAAILLFAVATRLLVRALERDDVAAWTAYTVAVVGLGALNTIALATVAGHLVVLRAHDKEVATVRRFAASWVAALLVLTPLVAMGATQAHGQVGWVARPTVSSAWRTLPQMLWSTPVAVCVVVLVVGALLRGGPALTWAGVAVAPIAVVLVASFVAPTSYWYPRYLLFTLPAWALAAALATRAAPVAVAVVAVVAMAAAGLPAQRDLRAHLAHDLTNYPYDALTPVDYQAVASIIAAGYRPGDGVAPLRLGNEFEMMDLGLRYYLPHGTHPPDVFVARTAAARGSFYASDLSDPTMRTVTAKRVWVVGMWNVDDALLSLSTSEAAFLRRHYTLKLRRSATPVIVVELWKRAR